MVTETAGVLTIAGNASDAVVVDLTSDTVTRAGSSVTLTGSPDLTDVNAGGYSVGNITVKGTVAEMITAGPNLTNVGETQIIDTAAHLDGFEGDAVATSITALVEASYPDLTGYDLSNVTAIDLNGQTTILTAAQANNVDIIGAGGVTITGSEGDQVLHVLASGTNNISGGPGADQITLGDGTDTLVEAFGLAAVAQQEAVTLSGTYEVGDTAPITINDIAIDYTVVANDLTTDGVGGGGAILGNSAAALGHIATKLAALVDANADVTSSAAGAVVTVVDAAPGTGFAIATATTNLVGANTQVISLDTQTVANIVALDSHSTLATPDIITGFAIGTDKIDLLSSSAEAVAAPGSVTRVTDVVGTGDLATDLATAFAGIGANAAGIAVVTGAGEGTYMFVNDSSAAMSATADLFIVLVGCTGTLDAVGALTVGDYFV